MASGEDWLFRPVLRRHLHIRELDDGSVSLAQVADLNEALDVEDINRRKIEEIKRGRRN